MSGVRVAARWVYIFASGERVLLQVELRWSPKDPHAVKLWFPREKKTWLFARELVVAALTSAAAGDGDVQFWTHEACPEYVGLDLTSPDGHAELLAPRKALIDLIVESEPGFRAAVDAWQDTWLEGVLT